MRISVWDRGLDDSYLKLITQLGADAIDFSTDSWFSGVQERGRPDFDELLKIKKKIYSWGLEINRVTLPNISEKFMSGQNESEIELENTNYKGFTCLCGSGFPIGGATFRRWYLPTVDDTLSVNTPRWL